MAVLLPLIANEFVGLAGLTVSVFGLYYSVKAERAATRAAITAKSALAATEAARSENRKRSIADELHDAQRRTQQIGTFLTQREWKVVHVLAQELTHSCSQILARFDVNALSEKSRDNPLKVQQQANSIVKASMQASQTLPDQASFARICSAQQKGFELLSNELAAIEGIIDRTEVSHG